MHKFVYNKVYVHLLRVSVAIIIIVLLAAGTAGVSVTIRTVSASTPLAVLEIIYLSTRSDYELYGQFLRRSVLSSLLLGFFSGIVLSVAGRVGLALNYIMFSSDKMPSNLSQVFFDYWWTYVCVALFGMICMSIKPLLRKIKRSPVL